MSFDAQNPPRIAIVGSGPAAFYTAQHLLQHDPVPRIDMFEKLPAPFGLVRYGVAPDHAKIKSVTAVYEKLAADERFRLFANVDYGSEFRYRDPIIGNRTLCVAVSQSGETADTLAAMRKLSQTGSQPNHSPK